MHGMGGITPIGPFSEGELLIILLIILIVMGPGRLPQLARALGEAMREFRKAVSGEYEREKRREQAGDR
jgi:sec-independent protein translocase protein TatA